MPLDHLHLEMVPWDGGGVMFNDQLVVGWIKLQGVGGEQGGHRDRQLYFGDARPQAGMVPQAKWRVGTWLAMLVARRAEALKVELHGGGIQLLQEMGHGHGDLHVLAWFQAIAAKGQRSSDTRPVTTRHRVASQGLHHCPLQVWHLFELLPRE